MLSLTVNPKPEPLISEDGRATAPELAALRVAQKKAMVWSHMGFLKGIGLTGSFGLLWV